MRSHACKTADDWTSSIVEHGAKCPLKTDHFVWDDRVGSAFGVHCLRCGTTFTVSVEALQSDQSNRAQILYNGLKTSNGREILLRTIAQRVDEAKRTRHKTAWDHVLEDD